MKIRRTLSLAKLITISLLALASAAALHAVPPAPHVNMVLVYAKHGGFIAIQPAQDLIVYDTGLAFLATHDFPSGSAKICSATATSDQLTTLQNQLAAAGAFFLPNDPFSVPPDAPGMTLTFFVPRPDSDRARANTFSFGGLAAAPYLQAEAAVQSFIAELFPNC